MLYALISSAPRNNWKCWSVCKGPIR